MILLRDRPFVIHGPTGEDSATQGLLDEITKYIESLSGEQRERAKTEALFFWVFVTCQAAWAAGTTKPVLDEYVTRLLDLLETSGVFLNAAGRPLMVRMIQERFAEYNEVLRGEPSPIQNIGLSLLRNVTQSEDPPWKTLVSVYLTMFYTHHVTNLSEEIVRWGELTE